MRLSRETLKLAVLFVSMIVTVTFPASQVQAQDGSTQAEASAVVKWKPNKLEVSSENSRLDLELPDLAPDADWVVGVQEIEGNERETASIGLVSWEDSSKNPALAGKPFKTKIPSQITDYPLNMIQIRRGKITLPGLARLDKDSNSLIVHLNFSARQGRPTLLLYHPIIRLK